MIAIQQPEHEQLLGTGNSRQRQTTLPLCLSGMKIGGEYALNSKGLSGFGQPPIYKKMAGVRKDGLL